MEKVWYLELIHLLLTIFPCNFLVSSLIPVLHVSLSEEKDVSAGILVVECLLDANIGCLVLYNRQLCCLLHHVVQV